MRTSKLSVSHSQHTFLTSSNAKGLREAFQTETKRSRLNKYDSWAELNSKTIVRSPSHFLNYVESESQIIHESPAPETTRAGIDLSGMTS